MIWNTYWFICSVPEREPVVPVAEPEAGIDAAAPERGGISETQPASPPPEPEAELPIVEEQEAQDLNIPQVPVVGPDVAAPGEEDERPRQRAHMLSPSPSPEQDERPIQVNNKYFFI